MTTAASFLTPERLNRWRLWPALAQRNDLVMLQRACSDVTAVLFGALCAVNRIYIEHPSFKWSRHLTGRFTRAPANFAGRLFGALDRGPISAAPVLHALLTETAQLVASEMPEVDLTPIGNALHGSR